MTEHKDIPEIDQELEQYPVEPRYHPIHKIPRKIYDFLASSKLAMTLLVAILASCVAGVTVLRGDRAWALVFNTLWFNGLLVLLVINVACCFFGRVWRRKLTLVSFGMILFHLSFVAMFLGIVYNSLFLFRGSIRLTEGEVLRSADPQSYDKIQTGRFFSFSRLKGETTLIRMHANYKVGSEDKMAAYEVAVGEGTTRKQDIIYITQKLTHRGVDYLNDSEGYSLLVVLSDKGGKELYGAHLPLQSMRQGDGSYRYTLGYTHEGIVHESILKFPQPPGRPLFDLQVVYEPSKLVERAGGAQFQLYPLGSTGAKPFAEGKIPIGERFDVGEYALSAKEVRYWVVMTVRYEPGKPIVLASLWVGLAGMLLTTVGRMIRSRK